MSLFIKQKWVVSAVLVLLIGSAQAQAFDRRVMEKKLKALSTKSQKAFLDSITRAHSQQEIMEGIPYISFCIDYAWKNKFDNIRIAEYFYRRASLYRKTAQYAKALSDYGRAESIYFEEKNNAGLESVYSGYAGLYSRIGEHLKAIKYIKLALQKAEITRNEDQMGVSYNDLGTVYKNMKLYDSAAHFYNKSKEIYLKNKGYYQAALILDNIAIMYTELNRLDSAAYYNDMAFEMARPLKNTFLELQLLFSVCGISEKNRNYETQLSASKRAKFLADSLNIPYYQMMCDGNYAVALKNNNREREALEIFKRIQPAMKQSGDYAMMENFYGEMSSLFSLLGQSDSALAYFKLSTAFRDTVEKMAERGRVGELIARYNLEEKEKSIQDLKQQKSAEQEKGRLKSIIIWVAAGMMMIVLALLAIIIMRYRENRKLNREITSKNTDLAEKQKEILDSINYAKKIQYALLAHDDLLKQNLPEHFVLFKPKDIVSGDFYWGTIGKSRVLDGGDNFYLAVCDSTGHGVPGAFMSLLNISFLNEAINEKGIEAPHEVFNHVRKRLIENVSHEGAQDGMDATLIKFRVSDFRNQLRATALEIEYAAAHHSPVIIRKGNVLELPFDKMPIGKGESTANFKLQTARLEPGDVLYLYTDGFGDQFGGPKGKKYKENNLRKLLSEIYTKDMSDQKRILQQTLDSWKGNLDQVDDVCMIGIKL